MKVKVDKELLNVLKYNLSKLHKLVGELIEKEEEKKEYEKATEKLEERISKIKHTYTVVATYLTLFNIHLPELDNPEKVLEEIENVILTLEKEVGE